MLFTSKGEDATIKIADLGEWRFVVVAVVCPAVSLASMLGFARYIGNGKLHTPCGSYAYVAPEIMKEEEYGKAVDMWSLGVILYLL